MNKLFLVIQEDLGPKVSLVRRLMFYSLVPICRNPLVPKIGRLVCPHWTSQTLLVWFAIRGECQPFSAWFISFLLEHCHLEALSFFGHKSNETWGSDMAFNLMQSWVAQINVKRDLMQYSGSPCNALQRKESQIETFYQGFLGDMRKIILKNLGQK